MKPIPVGHFEKIYKGTAICIKNSITQEQRERFKNLEKPYEVEYSVGARFNEHKGQELIVPYVDPDIPEDIRDVLFNCFGGVFQKYCEQNGL